MSLGGRRVRNRRGQKGGVGESNSIFCEYFLEYYFTDLTVGIHFSIFLIGIVTDIYTVYPNASLFLLLSRRFSMASFFLLSVTLQEGYFFI